MGRIRIRATDPVFGFAVGVIDLWVHDVEACAGRRCCIHRPSRHHMADWPQLWRADRGLMERLCPHEVGHPDPDDIEFKLTEYGDEAAAAARSHGCDGCCR